MPVKASSSSSVRSAAAALWLGSLMAVPAEARHAGSSKEPQLRRAARELRQKVEAALGRADFALAHKLLDDAYRQSPQPQTLYLLGRLDLHFNRVDQGMQRIEEAARMANQSYIAEEPKRLAMGEERVGAPGSGRG